MRDHGLVDSGLARHQFRQCECVGNLPVFAHDLDEAIVIVIADEAAEVFVARKLDAARAENLGEGLEVKRFGVGEGAVQIEYDGADANPRDLGRDG